MGFVRKAAIAASIATGVASTAFTAAAIGSYAARDQVLAFGVEHQSPLLTSLAIGEGAKATDLIRKKGEAGDFPSVEFITEHSKRPDIVEPTSFAYAFYHAAAATRLDVLDAMHTHMPPIAWEAALERMVQRLNTRSFSWLLYNGSYGSNTLSAAIKTAAEAPFQVYYEEDRKLPRTQEDASYIIKALIEKGADAQKAISDMSYSPYPAVAEKGIALIKKVQADIFASKLEASSRPRP